MKKMMMCAGAAAVLLSGCESDKTLCDHLQEGPTVKLITLDPGHFHAALIQNRMYPDVSPKVHIYAPEGNDLQMHMARINGFNARTNQPTAWQSEVYTGADFLDKMLKDKAGNVVVLAGNNSRKTEYILKCVQAGYNVLSDKPMAITPKDFELLKQAFEVARQKGVLLYDIMTERNEITSMLQRELSLFPKVYGVQEKGTPDDPAVTKESVHHFCKLVAGKPLQRPPWYYDTRQQGEAIVDVNTHLTDLVQWETFPNVTLAPSDIKVIKARTWNTPVTLEQFTTSTSIGQWPEYLKRDLDAGGVLQCRANGAFTYAIKGVYAKVSVLWNFQPPAGAGDTHYSLMRGTTSELIIRQGAEQKYKPMLYVEPRAGADVAALEKALAEALVTINAKYPGVASEKTAKGWQITIPAAYAVGHEAHFGQVAEKYLGYLKNRDMPVWEVPNMLVKYHTLMEAYRLSR